MSEPGSIVRGDGERTFDGAIQRILNDPRYQLDIGSWEEAKKLIGRWVDKEP